MILMINGAFGIGKSTVACLLRQSLEGSAIYDPEWAGFVLRCLPSFVGLRGTGTDDFQDIHLWRKSVIVGTRLTRKFTQGVVIVPMTFSRYDYLQEIVAGIQQFDKVVKVFCLKAELPIILRRLQQRGTKFDRVEGEWARRKTQTCVDAHRNPAFGEAINTEKLSAAEVAQEILKRL